MGGTSSTLTDEFARAKNDELEIACELAPGAVAPTWSAPGSSTLTVYSESAVELRAHAPTRVETGVSLQLPYALVAQVLPHGGMEHVVTTAEVFCCEVPTVVLTLTYRPPSEVAPHSMRIEAHMAVGRLLVIPLARPVLKLQTREIQEVSGKVRVGVAEAAAAANEPVAAAADVV